MTNAPDGAGALARVAALSVYPVKGEPGTTLPTAQIEDEGLAGDRRKKRPVHLVGAEHADDGTRANIVLDVPDAALAALLGRDVALGDAVLHLAERPSNCPGLYAVVARPGTVSAGDPLVDVTP